LTPVFAAKISQATHSVTVSMSHIIFGAYHTFSKQAMKMTHYSRVDSSNHGYWAEYCRISNMCKQRPVNLTIMRCLLTGWWFMWYVGVLLTGPDKVTTNSQPSSLGSPEMNNGRLRWKYTVTWQVGKRQFKLFQYRF
jgi:hypothetical protein